ncbi:MAG: Fic family protein [Acidobacteria bacterium]|nr:Fic family protein [Acidobacteriota bacterium]
MQTAVPEKLPIQGINWERHIPLIGKANRSLARYDGVLHGIPNPEVLLSPLRTQEAVLSSMIEGTQATLGDVFKFEAGEEPERESRTRDIQEILNYRKALREAERALKDKPFNLNLLLRLHATLLDSVRGRDKARGRFRTDQNWIGKPGSTIEAADYVPPKPGLVVDYMDNWEKYYHAERPDALVQLAIVHAQFEIIHPFLDGNGRLGRMLIPLFLCERRILHRPMFYLSAYLEQHRDSYIGGLRELSGDPTTWDHWIEFFLKALHEQAEKNAETARKIIQLYSELKERVLHLTHSQFAVPLLDKIFKRPIFQTKDVSFGANQPSRQAIQNLIRTLRDANVLKIVREGRGRRGQLLVLPELMNLCEGRKVY